MYRHEMSDVQWQNKEIFNAKLSRAGWSIGGVSELLETDAIDVTPEAVASLTTPDVELMLAYHAREDYIAWGIADSVHSVLFRCHGTKRLEEALDTMIRKQDTITIETYAFVLKDLLDLFERIDAEIGGQLMRIERQK